MDQNLIRKAKAFLDNEDPDDADIIEAATVLLRMAPGRERALYNSTVRRPRAFLKWIRRDLRKYYDIRMRGLTNAQTKEYNEETVKIVTETLSQKPETLKDEEEDESKHSVPVQSIRGKRADHDTLPENIRSLWDKNAERWKKMRAMHAQLAIMIQSKDYQPCDGNELCFQLREADTALRNDYDIYDNYVLMSGSEEKKDDETVFTDNVKTIQNARSAITRNLKENPTEKQLQKLQDAVNALMALHQTLKPETIERLKAVGVAIPEL